MISADLSQLGRRRQVTTRSISPENLDGSPGGGGRAIGGTGAQAARDLGPGWKLSPSVEIGPAETLTLGQIDGAGEVTHLVGRGRDQVLPRRRR